MLNSKPFSVGSFEYIKVDRRGEKKNVGFIQLNRPKALNALNSDLMNEVNAAVKEFDNDDGIGCIVLTGSDRAFAGEFGGGEIMSASKVLGQTPGRTTTFLHFE